MSNSVNMEGNKTIKNAAALAEKLMKHPEDIVYVQVAPSNDDPQYHVGWRNVQILRDDASNATVITGDPTESECGELLDDSNFDLKRIGEIKNIIIDSAEWPIRFNRESENIASQLMQCSKQELIKAFLEIGEKLNEQIDDLNDRLLYAIHESQV